MLSTKLTHLLQHLWLLPWLLPLWLPLPLLLLSPAVLPFPAVRPSLPFANPEQYRHEETLRDYDFGRGRTEPYATQPKEGRGKGAADWYRANPHRLHLGTIGFAEVTPEQIASIDQQLALQEGVIYSSFTIDAAPVRVETCASPTLDCLAKKSSN